MNATLVSSAPADLEAILPPVALGLFVAYLIAFLIVLHFQPLRLNLGFKMAVRREWAYDIVHSNSSIVAVQTLRNSQNSANVFASASVVVAFFAFQQASSLSAVLPLQSVKFYSLGCGFVAAFLSFGICSRDAEQCGYLSFTHTAPLSEIGGLEVQLSPKTRTIRDVAVRAEACARSASQSAFFWSLGLKFFYLCVCIGGWIAGAIPCLVLTCIVILVMFFLDRSITLGLTYTEGQAKIRA